MGEQATIPAASAGAQAGASGSTTTGAQDQGAKGGETETSRSKAWEAVEHYKSQNAELQKKVSAYEAAEKKKADEEAVKRGDFEKLTAQEKARADAAEGRAKQAQIRSALLEQAMKEGLPPTRLALLDTSKLEVVGDEVKGVAAVFKALREADPGVFGTPDVKTTQTKTAAGPAGGAKFDPSAKFTEADVRKMTKEQREAFIKHRTGSRSGNVDWATGRRG